MAYATDIELGARLTQPKLIELTDFDNTGLVNSARVAAALEAASGVIDSYAGGRYGLPLAASQQVVDLTLRITIYKLWEGRQRQAPEIVVKSYDDAIAFLKDVSMGKAMLDQPATPQASGLDVQKRDHVADPERIDENKLEAY